MSNLEVVNCDLCGSKEYEILFRQTDILHKTTEETFQFVRCRNCSLHFINPRPKSSQIGKYYVNDYAFHKPESALKNMARDLLRNIVNKAISIK